MEKFHTVENLSCNADRLRLTIDGRILEFDIASLSTRLASATEEELGNVEVSPGGYGLHWPLLDEDIAIDGLLEATHEPGPLNRRIGL